MTVIEEYFSQMDEKIDVEIESIREMPHGRFFTLSWDDGSELTIRFDHGVGCWSIDGRTSRWLDVKSEPQTQVLDMYNILRTIRVRYRKNHPTQIFIKSR